MVNKYIWIKTYTYSIVKWILYYWVIFIQMHTVNVSIVITFVDGYKRSSLPINSR